MNQDTAKARILLWLPFFCSFDLKTWWTCWLPWIVLGWPWHIMGNLKNFLGCFSCVIDMSSTLFCLLWSKCRQCSNSHAFTWVQNFIWCYTGVFQDFWRGSTSSLLLYSPLKCCSSSTHTIWPILRCLPWLVSQNKLMLCVFSQNGIALIALLWWSLGWIWLQLTVALEEVAFWLLRVFFVLAELHGCFGSLMGWRLFE